MLHHVMCKRAWYPGIVKVLLHHQADVNAEDKASVEMEMPSNVHVSE